MDVFSSATMTEEQKQHLRNYKYAGSDNSIILRLFYRPVLEWVVERVPLFTAPNLITMMGFCSVNSAAVLTLYNSPDLRTELPTWNYVYNGVAIWLYQWLDNLDGKQARRTKSSSAFGELFDHGVDAYACTTAGICFIAGLRLGVTPLSVLSPFLVYLPFFSATWEQFWLGSMDLGVINGPMEGVFSLVCFMFLGAIVGGEFFSNPFLGSKVSVGDACATTSFALCVACVSTNIYNTLRFVNAHPGFTVATPVKHWGSVALMILFTCIVVGNASNADLAEGYVGLAYIFINGIVFGHLGTNLTLLHLTKSPFPSAFSILLVPLVLAVNAVCATVVDTGFPPAVGAWIGVALLLLHTIVYKYLLIRSLLDTIGINLFSLTDEQKARIVGASENGHHQQMDDADVDADADAIDFDEGNSPAVVGDDTAAEMV